MTNLNNTNSPISREERNKINGNWEAIQQSFTSVNQSVIQIDNKVDDATTIANQADAVANDALNVANGIDGKATEAIDTANNATNTAIEATETAINAKTIAEGIDGKATSALQTAAEAEQNSNDAIEIAIDAETLAETVRSQFNEVIAEAGSNNPEVVASRIDTESGEQFVSLPDRLDKQHRQLTTQLAQTTAIKADISFVNSELAKVASGAPNETFHTLADLQATYPTGDNNNKLVASDGHIYHWNDAEWEDTGILYQAAGIAKQGVDFDKLADDTVSKVFEWNNIFLKDTVTNGVYVNNAGEVLNSSSLGVSDFIRVIPNQYYALPAVTSFPGVFYAEDKSFIMPITFLNGTVFKVPSNARFIKVNANVVDPTNVLHIDKYMIVFGKTYPAKYVPYGVDGYNIVVGKEQIKNKSITGSHFKDIRNLFDKTKLTSGYIDNAGVITASATLSHSDPIPVEPNGKYSLPHVSSVTGGFYDSNNNWLSAITSKTFMVPHNAAFIRVNVNVSDSTNIIHKDSFMVVKDATYPSQYVPYNVPFFDWLLNAYIPSKDSNKWLGKTIYSFGDSITWYDGNTYGGNHVENGKIAKGYLTYMREELGATVHNFGISGGTIQNHISNAVKTKNFTGISAVTITGGVNDWATTSSPPSLGAIAPIGSAFDITTSYGALQSAVEYILSTNPKIKIYFITPIRGYLKPESTNPKAGQEFPESYADIWKSVGKLYGIPVCDWYNNTGFNKLNYESWYKDKGSLIDRNIHVGDEGYKRMAEILVPFLVNN